VDSVHSRGGIITIKADLVRSGSIRPTLHPLLQVLEVDGKTEELGDPPRESLPQGCWSSSAIEKFSRF